MNQPREKTFNGTEGGLRRAQEDLQMKRTIAILAVMVAVALAVPSMAQSAGPRGGTQGQGQGQRQGEGQGGGRMMMNPDMQKKVKAAHDKVVKELKLNATQTKAVAAAVKKRDDSMKKMMEQMQADRKAGKQPNREDMQAKFKKIRDTYDAEMKKAMGEANYKKYQTRMQEEMKKIMEEARKNGQGGGKPGGGKPGGGKGI